jgi:trimethylamine--corrinoid protein Co-methyltransferase
MKCNSASFESDRPHIKVLPREKIEKIHEASLEILQETGVSMRLPEALELLATAGCDVKGDLVKIPRRIVEECLDMAPDRIDVYDRLENMAMQLEGRNSHFGTGPTIQYVMDPETGEHRDSTMEDIEAAARIVDYLPNLDFCMTMGMAGGVNPQTAGLNPLVTDRYDFAAMLKNTIKPLMFSNWSLEGLKDCYQMALAAKNGDEESLREKPFIMVYCEPTTPLIHDRDPLNLALFCAEKSIPLLNISAPVAGGSFPLRLPEALHYPMPSF